MMNLVAYFEGQPLTKPAHDLLNDIEGRVRRAGLEGVDPGNVLEAIIALEGKNDSAASRHLRLIGFDRLRTTTFVWGEGRINNPTKSHQLDNFLREMAKVATGIARGRHRGASVNLADIAVGAVLSDSWLVTQILDKFGLSRTAVADKMMPDTRRVPAHS